MGQGWARPMGGWARWGGGLQLAGVRCCVPPCLQPNPGARQAPADVSTSAASSTPPLCHPPGAAELMYGVITAVLVSNWVAHHLHPDGARGRARGWAVEASAAAWLAWRGWSAAAAPRRAGVQGCRDVLAQLHRLCTTCTCAAPAGLYEAELESTQSGTAFYLRQVARCPVVASCSTLPGRAAAPCCCCGPQTASHSPWHPPQPAPQEPPHALRAQTAESVMASPAVCLRGVERVSTVLQVLRTTSHNGFPVVAAKGSGSQRDSGSGALRGGGSGDTPHAAAAAATAGAAAGAAAAAEPGGGGAGLANGRLQGFVLRTQVCWQLPACPGARSRLPARRRRQLSQPAPAPEHRRCRRLLALAAAGAAAPRRLL